VKSRINIELFEEHDKVNFYTLRFEGEETETDKFLDQFTEACEFEEDLDILIRSIDKIGERGALERYFRMEGKIKDRVCAIPIESASLRLYLIRLSDNIVILGNGGVKKTEKYEEDIFLNNCVELLQEIDRIIKRMEQNQRLHIYQKNLFGNLTFYIDRHADEK
jgi:hypothetical protein